MRVQQPDEQGQAGTGRVFIALWPPVAVAEEIVRRAGPVMAARGGRHAHPGDLHLTLAFLGVLEARKLAAAAEVLARCRQAAVDLDLDRLGCFKGASVLWIAPSHPPARLEALHRRLWRGLAAVGFEPERRRFKPHLTLARRVRPMRSEALEPPVHWRAEVLALATSTGAASGSPRYRKLAVRALAPA